MSVETVGFSIVWGTIAFGLLKLSWYFKAKPIKKFVIACANRLRKILTLASALPIALAFLVIVGSLIVFFAGTTLHGLAASGDYVGGWLNPLVGLITVILLVRTLRTQAQALALQESANKASDTRTEAMLELQRISSFEQTLFTLTASYRSNLSSLSANKNGVQLHGPEALEISLTTKFTGPMKAKLRAAVIPILDRPITELSKDERDLLLAEKNQLISEWHVFLLANPSFRSLLSEQMQLFRWVDRQTFPKARKREYAAAIRAQMTRAEVASILIHLLDEHLEKELQLVNSYGLLALLATQNTTIGKLSSRILRIEGRLKSSAFRWRGDALKEQALQSI